jgi:hypothetical protein
MPAVDTIRSTREEWLTVWLLYDGVIAKRAGWIGNRVLASAAMPKPRDFYLGCLVGVLTLAIALSS